MMNDEIHFFVSVLQDDVNSKIDTFNNIEVPWNISLQNESLSIQVQASQNVWDEGTR